MANRKFDAYFSEDKGHTWKKFKSSGWPISDVSGEEKEGDFGFVIALDAGDTMIDIGIPEKMLNLMLKDINKLRQSDDTTVRRRIEGVSVNDTSAGTEDQP
jgi:hypothetical protein